MERERASGLISHLEGTMYYLKGNEICIKAL